MKRISFSWSAILLAIAVSAQAQDAATEERLNKLSGQVEDIIAAQRAQQKSIETLAKEIDSLREHLNKPSASYATPEDLKRLSEAVREVDRKRIEDSEKVAAQLSKLGKVVSSTSAPPPKKPATAAVTENTSTDKPAKDEKGYPYTIQQGDTLSLIVQAYREKNIKVSTDQILKANPGLKADKLRPGQKIWIPASPQA